MVSSWSRFLGTLVLGRHSGQHGGLECLGRAFVLLAFGGVGIFGILVEQMFGHC